MFCWSFASLVHFWPPPIGNSGYAYGFDFDSTTLKGNLFTVLANRLGISSNRLVGRY